MDLLNLKIVSKKELRTIKEDFGVLLRNIEYLKDNPKTEKIHVFQVVQTAIDFRKLLNDL